MLLASEEYSYSSKSAYLCINAFDKIKHGAFTMKCVGLITLPLALITDPIIYLVATIMKGITRSYVCDRDLQRDYARYLANVMLYLPGQLYIEGKIKAKVLWDKFKALF